MDRLALIAVAVGLSGCASTQQPSAPTTGESSDRLRFVSRVSNEARYVLSRVAVLQHAYFQQHHEFVSTAETDADVWPVRPQGPAAARPMPPSEPESWSKLALRFETDEVMCSYVTVAGNAGAVLGGERARAFGLTLAPKKRWWYAIAVCPAIERSFIRTSWDTGPSFVDEISMRKSEAHARLGAPNG